MTGDRPKRGTTQPAGGAARDVLQRSVMGLPSVDSVGRAASKTQSRGRTTTAESTTRVMIVEDDRDLRDVYAAALEDEGFSVRVASEGRSALAQLNDGTFLPCVVLLDLRMPGMNGWELAAHLRRSARLRRIPIVVVAAHYLLADEALRLGATAWLQKPVPLHALVRAVEDACRGAGEPPS